MRILLAANRFFGDVRGGGNRVAWDAARRLNSKGHEVALLCEGIDHKPERESIDGILILRYRVSKSDFNLLNRHQRAACRTLRNHLSDWKPDLLWGHMPLQTQAMLNVFPETKLSYTVHSPAALEMLESQPKVTFSLRIKSALLSRIERSCLERATVITVLSGFTKTELRKIHGESIVPRIHLTPGWTDTSTFKPAASRTEAKMQLGWPVDRPVFFSLRRLVPRTGIDLLISAAGIVRDRGLRFMLYIGGTGPLKQKLQDQIESLGLLPLVKLLGGIPEEELSSAYAAPDAFVIPTKALECFGLIAVEAMAAGTPVLSTPIGALPEILQQIEPRWLSRDASAEAIADLMCDFINGKLPTHDANELRQFVESRYAESNALETFVRAGLGEPISSYVTAI